MLYCLRAIKLNLLPTTPFVVYMHDTHLTFGKLFVRKQDNVLVFILLIITVYVLTVKLYAMLGQIGI